MITLELEQKLEKLIQSCGCELYGIEMLKEHHQDILRISLYAKGGVSLNQCQEVSNLISPLLDVEDPIKDEYLLEVSSPGIERVLKNPRHFLFSIGEKIQVKFMDKTFLEGILGLSDAESFVLKNEEGEHRISYAQTKKVKTIF